MKTLHVLLVALLSFSFSHALLAVRFLHAMPALGLVNATIAVSTFNFNCQNMKYGALCLIEEFIEGATNFDVALTAQENDETVLVKFNSDQWLPSTSLTLAIVPANNSDMSLLPIPDAVPIAPYMQGYTGLSFVHLLTNVLTPISVIVSGVDKGRVDELSYGVPSGFLRVTSQSALDVSLDVNTNTATIIDVGTTAVPRSVFQRFFFLGTSGAVKNVSVVQPTLPACYAFSFCSACQASLPDANISCGWCESLNTCLNSTDMSCPDKKFASQCSKSCSSNGVSSCLSGSTCKSCFVCGSGLTAMCYSQKNTTAQSCASVVRGCKHSHGLILFGVFLSIFFVLLVACSAVYVLFFRREVDYQPIQ